MRFICSGKISQRTNMIFFSLLTLLLITDDSALGQTTEYNHTGFIGYDVVLPCKCPENTMILAWQIGHDRIVSATSPGVKIDPDYINRTVLFLNEGKKNCSLLLRNVSKEDEEVYTCYAIEKITISKILSTTRVQLNVSEMEAPDITPEPLKDETSVTAVSIGVPILIVGAILTLLLLTTLLMRRRHRINKDTDIPAQQPMIPTYV